MFCRVCVCVCVCVCVWVACAWGSRNDRNVRNTPYQYLPSRVEQASIETYAVKTRSLPPGGKSMLDTLGATVAFVIRYDLGTVCYIGYNYNTPFHADQWTRVLHCAIDM
jgi:hypothetical protein